MDLFADCLNGDVKMCLNGLAKMEALYCTLPHIP